MKNIECALEVSKDNEQNVYTFEFKTLKDVKIVDAILKFKSNTDYLNVKIFNHTENAENEPWLVDLINIVNTKENCINVSDELQYAIDEGKNYLKLSFENATISKEDAKIDINYISKCEYRSNGTTHSVDSGKAGSASVDIATGGLFVKTPLTSSTKNALPLSISANYKTVTDSASFDVGLPNNWTLNMNQFLIKDETENEKLRFSYIDENGNTQIIEEKYYFLDENDERVYIKREELCVDLDGNLTYKKKTGENEYTTCKVEVSLEAPSGLKLVSSIDGISGYELVDFEPEELIQVKQNLSDLNNTVTEIKDAIALNEKQICLYALSKKVLDEQLENQKAQIVGTEENLKLQEQIEKIRYNSLMLSRNFTNPIDNETKTYAKNYLKSTKTDIYSQKRFNDKMIEALLNYFKNSTPITNDNSETLTGADIGVVGNILGADAAGIYAFGLNYDNQGTIKMQKESNELNKKIYIETLEKNDFKTLIKESFKKFAEFDLTDELNKYVTDNSNSEKTEEQLREEFFKQNTFTDAELESLYNSLNGGEEFAKGLKDSISLELQIFNLIKTNISYHKKISEYEEQIQKLNHKQELLEMQVPVHYLYNSENVLYGFGKTSNSNIFRLILIADAYENTIFISYKSLDSNKIESITDSTEKSVVFEYEKSSISITDTQDNKIVLNVEENNNLKSISRNNEIIAYYYYYNDNRLCYMLDNSGIGSKFTYSNMKVSQINSISGIDKVENGNVKFKTNFSFDSATFDEFLLTDEYINFEYDNYKSTTLTNAKGKSNTYLFDKLGNIRTIYENKFNDNAEESFVNVTEINYKDNKMSSKITPLPYSPNYLNDVCFDESSMVQKDALYLSESTLLCESAPLIPYQYQSCDKVHTILASKQNKIESIAMSQENIDLINATNELCSHKTYMISGWAKADSAFIITDENEQDYPNYVVERKFEIRVKVTYADATQETTSRKFDWRNTGWQYCGLPLNIQNKNVSSVECFIDYSGNTGDIHYTDFEMKQSDWEIVEYNGNLPVRKESAHSKWYTTYEYDKNDRLIKETIFKKNQTADETSNTGFSTNYEYTKQGKLLRTTSYNGIIKENVFNDKGVVIKTITYHKDEPSSKLFEEQLVDDKGNETGQVNELGEEVIKYESFDTNGAVTTQVDEKGNKTSFGYDKDGTLLETASTVDGIANTNTYGYNLDFLVSLKHNGFEINYDYDDKGRVTKIKVADANYLEKSYGKNEQTAKLCSNEQYRQTFTDNNEVLDTYYKKDDNSQEELISRNVYDLYGNLVLVNDLTDNNYYRIYRDKFGNVYREENTQHSKQFAVESTFDESHSNVESSTISLGDDKLKYQYDYSSTDSPDVTLSKIKLLNKNDATILTQKINQDKLGRISSISTNSLSKEFTYLKVGEHTSNFVSKVQFAVDNVNKDALRYKYDKKGNITEIRENNNLIARYEYDGLSRIAREDNKLFGKTTVYSYDAGGNITQRVEYPFTLVENLDMLEGSPLSYSYKSTGWRDQLMEFNGKTFLYDELGNPKQYGNIGLDWSHGRRLDNLYKNNADGTKTPIASYKYNAHGLRTSKIYYTNSSCQCKTDECTCDNCDNLEYFTTQFYLNGNKIIKQIDSCNELTFYYGADGITGFHLKNNLVDEDYFYKKNAQNDIIGIYSTKNDQIARYSYDCWGKQKIEFRDNNGIFVAIDDDFKYNDISNINRFIAYKNPFRYRSYYYDFETGLYYLNSRYYDPEIGRFINADDISVLDEAKEFINGFNLYVYCNNNPVMNSDESGKKWWEWLVGSLLLLTAVIITVATAGAAAGTLAATIHAISCGALISGLTSAVAGVIFGGVSIDSSGNVSWNVDGASSGFMWGTITGLIAGALGVKLGNVGSKLSKASFALIQVTFNSLISFGLTSLQGLITNTFSIESSLISFVIGALGGLAGTTSFGKGFKNVLVGIGLTLAEGIINEIFKILKSNNYFTSANLLPQFS